MQKKFNIENQLLDLKKQLQNHDIYNNLKNIQNIKTFTENHVFAVWDFMSLLKSLQLNLTCVSVPWYPAKNPTLTRFINEIVCVEESDLDEFNQPKSHFEMYLDAMKEINANTDKIDRFITLIKSGQSPVNAIDKVKLNPDVSDFVKFSFSVIESKKSHLIAAAFTFGRENIIPEMFAEILNNTIYHNNSYRKLVHYFNRHIEVDGDEHGPISLKMVSELCGDDELKWSETLSIAKLSVQKRVALWDGINSLIKDENKKLILDPIKN